MRVLVLGGGVIGVTTAYYLARAGHEVEVLDRRSGPAMETSFANAGQVSPGYASPWAGPGVPLKALKWLMMRHGPLVVRPVMDPRMWWWLLTLLRNCTSARYVTNKALMAPIAQYSRDCLRALRAETGISYDERSQGTLQLFRTHQQLDDSSKDIDVLTRLGIPFEMLNRRGCLAVEPGLARATATIVGGLRLPDDETGDCQIFTARLAGMAEQLGVQFTFNTDVKKIVRDGSRVNSVVTSRGRKNADAYVVALGTRSASLLRPFGLRIPVYPVKGYSLTAQITNAAAAPASTVMDETYKVAITRLGDRVRVGGTAELAGYDFKLRPLRREALEHSVSSLFPESCDLDRASFWCGLRPMTPDGPPLIGATPIDGLYLNTGHGTLGWTMACGSGRLLADIIGRQPTEIDVKGLGISRYIR
jgi:D-amino-acid dehydrogenase